MAHKRGIDEVATALLDEDLEEAMREMERAEIEDPIFGNVHRLTMWAEMEYRKANARRLMNNPMHECSDSCGMALLTAKVYRRRELTSLSREERDQYGDAYTSTKSGMAGFLDPMVYSRFYHMCIADSCPHVDPSHDCNETVCPHTFHASPANVREIKDIFACSITGNIHVCGALCHLKPLEANGRFICPLVKIVTGGIWDDAVFRPAIAYGEEDREKLLIGTSEETDMVIYTAKTKRLCIAHRADNTAVGSTDLEFEMNLALCRDHCEKLLFSVERQEAEAKTFLDAYQDMWTSTTKGLRLRKSSTTHAPGFVVFFNEIKKNRRDSLLLHFDADQNQPLCAQSILSTFQSKRPTSAYFSNVPMRDQIRSFIAARMLSIEQQTIGDTWPRHAQESTHPSASADALTAFMRQSIDAMRMRSSSDGAGRVLQWEDPAWKKKQAEIVDLLAFTVVMAWVNMNKHLDRARSTEFADFRQMICPILYMLRKTLLQTPPGANSPPVVVIPCVEFSELLPSNPGSYVQCPQISKITSLQTGIRKIAVAHVRRVRSNQCT
jgi:hypothetical protein